MLNLRHAALAVGGLLTLQGCAAGLLVAEAGGGVLGLRSADKMLKSEAGKQAMTNIPRATLASINRGLALQDLKVSDLVIGKRDATWTANTPAGRYSCSSSLPVLVGTAYCARR